MARPCYIDSRSVRLLVSATAAAVLISACAGGAPAPAGPPAHAGGPYPLGTLRTTAAVDPTCPPGHACQGMTVTCPNVAADAPGFLAVAEPTGTPRGVVVFFRGGDGRRWVLDAGRADLLQELGAAGFRVVQVRWAEPWLFSSPGEEAGADRLACRPATAVRWIHQTHFLPLGIARSESGRCGFCITGNSGGATQVSYALSHFGLDEILDAVIPTGGPPHAVLAKVCYRRPGEEQYWYREQTGSFLDRSSGFHEGGGPCDRQDPTYLPHWEREGVATGGSDYQHPRTRVHLLVGADDPMKMQAHASFYAERLRQAGSPWVTLETVPATPHDVLSTKVGREMFMSALLATR